MAYECFLLITELVKKFTLNLLQSQQNRSWLPVTHMVMKDSSSANQGRYSYMFTVKKPLWNPRNSLWKCHPTPFAHRERWLVVGEGRCCTDGRQWQQQGVWPDVSSWGKENPNRPRLPARHRDPSREIPDCKRVEAGLRDLPSPPSVWVFVHQASSFYMKCPPFIVEEYDVCIIFGESLFVIVS